MKQTARRFVATWTVVFLTASCGVPTGPDSFEAIDGEEVPNRLDETTTTTTTTLPPPTSATTPPELPATTLAPTTTIPQIADVQVYFLSRGELRPIPSPAPIQPEANDLILLLEDGPVGPLAPLLDNLVEDGLIETTSRADGVLTIALDDPTFRRIPVRRQTEAIAQMVLTFLTNLRGVGQAVFTIEGEVLSVPVSNGDFTDQPVSLDDYAGMEVDADPDTVTTTSTSTTTTVAPTAPEAPEEPVSTDAATTTAG